MPLHRALEQSRRQRSLHHFRIRQMKSPLTPRQVFLISASSSRVGLCPLHENEPDGGRSWIAAVPESLRTSGLGYVFLNRREASVAQRFGSVPGSERAFNAATGDECPQYNVFARERDRLGRRRARVTRLGGQTLFLDAGPRCSPSSPVWRRVSLPIPATFPIRRLRVHSSGASGTSTATSVGRLQKHLPRAQRISQHAGDQITDSTSSHSALSLIS